MEKSVANQTEREHDAAEPSEIWTPNRLVPMEAKRLISARGETSLEIPEGPRNNSDCAGILRRVAERLVSLADSVEAGHRIPEDEDQAIDPRWTITPKDKILAELAQVLYSSRRRRGKFLHHDLMGEPAWDILLDLFVHYVRNRALPTTSVCVASDVPVTTALRWVTLLERQGLIERGGLEHDKRTILVWLTKEGAQAVRDCLTVFWTQLHSVLV